MSKCIKCGRELTSGEIPEFNYGMCDKCYKDYQCKQYPFKKGIYDMQEEIKQLKQQLAEKQNTINEINKEFVQAVHDWKALCAKKDEEIEKLKQQNTLLENENGKLTTELIMDKYKKAQKEVSFGKQLAIQELAEVERLLYESHYKEIDNRYYAEYEDIKNLIDSRIQALEELKG